MKEFITTLSKKIQLTSDMLELHFTKPDGFEYTAGQFVQIKISDGDQFTYRSYSVASIPTDEHLELCVKLVPNGKGSTLFKDLALGDSITIRGPLGHFVCTEEAKGHFFVATGAGIAPILGMIRHELEQTTNTKDINLLFGVRFEEDVFWLDKLDALTQTFGNFSYRISLSRPTDGWTGLRGRVTEHLKDHPVDHDFYLCGSMDMVKDARALLLSNGVDAKKVRMEIF